jgi:hypothetical protein
VPEPIDGKQAKAEAITAKVYMKSLTLSSPAITPQTNSSKKGYLLKICLGAQLED